MRSALAALAATSVALALPAVAGAPGERHEPAGPAEPDGILVLAVLTPERAMVADPRTGATTARELPGGTLCHGPLLVTGGHVVFAGSRGRRAVALAALLRRLGAARPLGTGYTIASSAPGRVWIGRTVFRDAKVARLALREVSVDGRALTGARRLVPRWGALEGVVDGGLLITRGRGLVLRRPQQPALRFRGGPLAVAGDRFAWCPRGCRTVGVWSREGERSFEPPPGIRPEPGPRATFSPGGGRLALPVTTPAGSRVAVVDLARGAWDVLPDSRLGDYRATAWSPSGRWLYFAGRGERLLASREGAAPPVRLPIRTGGTVMSIATSRPGSAGR